LWAKAPALTWKSPVIRPPLVLRACIDQSMPDKAQYAKTENAISIKPHRNALAQQ